MPRDFFIMFGNVAIRHPEERSDEGSSYFLLKLAIANTSDIAIPTSGK